MSSKSSDGGAPAPRGPGPDPREELDRRLEAGPPEAWTRAALAVLALFAAMVFYLGLRPGGVGPIWVYLEGRLWVSVLALAVLLWGLAVSARRAPFVRANRMRAFFALTLVVGVANFPFPYPSSREGRPSPVLFRLPVEGEWTVYWGGEERDENRLGQVHPDRRYGLALVVSVDGRTHAGDGRAAEDYHAFDREVLAPADGLVVRVHDGEPDLPPGRQAGGEAFGNHLALEVAAGEYLFLCHLKQGSIRVRQGAQVKAGEPLARVGSSGRSPLTPEPHLALHLQNSPRPRLGEAVPWRFGGYLADGEPVSAGLPRGGLSRTGGLIGQRVRHASP